MKTFIYNLTMAAALAAALSAALPSQCAAFPFLVLNDGSLWQNIVLHELGVPSIMAPQRGTVTASAIDLALGLSSGGVYLAGMDLSLRDIRTHARPYGFDYLFFVSASRLRPVYSQSFARAKAIHQGGSHRVYAAWFKNQLASWPRRVFSLGGNNQVFEALGARELHGPGENPRKNYFTVIPLKGEGAERRQRGLEALKRAMNDERYAKTLNSELAPLLFPEKNSVDNGEIRKALEDMNGAYGGTGGRQTLLF